MRFLVLCYWILWNLKKSRLKDEIAHWNKRFSSLYQCLFLPETKNRNFILCWFYVDFMLVLCYEISMRNLRISWLTDEIAHWNKRFYSLYQCIFLPEIKNLKSLILCWFYVDFMLVLCYEISMRNLRISRLTDEIAHWSKRLSSLYQCLFLPETKNRNSNFMLILCWFYSSFMLWDFDAKFVDISAHRWASPLK